MGWRPQAVGTLAAALHCGFDQGFAIPALLAGLGILAAFLVPAASPLAGEMRAGLAVALLSKP